MELGKTHSLFDQVLREIGDLEDEPEESSSCFSQPPNSLIDENGFTHGSHRYKFLTSQEKIEERIKVENEIRKDPKIMKQANSFDFWALMDLLNYYEYMTEAGGSELPGFYLNRRQLLVAYEHGTLYVQKFPISIKYDGMEDLLKDYGAIMKKTDRCIPCFCDYSYDSELGIDSINFIWTAKPFRKLGLAKRFIKFRNVTHVETVIPSSVEFWAHNIASFKLSPPEGKEFLMDYVTGHQGIEFSTHSPEEGEKMKEKEVLPPPDTSFFSNATKRLLDSSSEYNDNSSSSDEEALTKCPVLDKWDDSRKKKKLKHNDSKSSPSPHHDQCDGNFKNCVFDKDSIDAPRLRLITCKRCGITYKKCHVYSRVECQRYFSPYSRYGYPLSYCVPCKRGKNRKQWEEGKRKDRNSEEVIKSIKEDCDKEEMDINVATTLSELDNPLPFDLRMPVHDEEEEEDNGSPNLQSNEEEVDTSVVKEDPHKCYYCHDLPVKSIQSVDDSILGPYASYPSSENVLCIQCYDESERSNLDCNSGEFCTKGGKWSVPLSSSFCVDCMNNRTFNKL